MPINRDIGVHFFIIYIRIHVKSLIRYTISAEHPRQNKTSGRLKRTQIL